jgi:DNA-binding NarL/FixJ family response regulator
MKVLLIDDHLLVENGVRTILERHYSPVTVKSAYDYGQALEVVETDTDFDLVLYDLESADVQRLKGLRLMIRCLGSIPVVVLSASEDPTGMREVLAVGAQGYIPKSASNEVVAGAIRVVLAGAKFVPFAALDLSHSTPAENNAGGDTATGRRAAESRQRARLSERQIQVLRLMITGKTNKEIGRTLSISETTARAHMTAIFKTLNVTNRTQACYVAAQLGLWSTTP